METICRTKNCPICNHFLLTVFSIDDKCNRTTILQKTSQDIGNLIKEGERWISDEKRIYYIIRPE